MNTCKNCIYWDNGICGYSAGWHPEHKWNMRPNGFEIECTADDDQGLEAQLKTGPDFGCIQFKQSK